MPITPLFAAIFGIMYVVLSAAVIKLRFKGQVSLGDGGDGELEKAIRVHGNFAEYVPFTLLLLWFVEQLSSSVGFVLILSVVLLVSRVSHCIGMVKPDSLTFRKFGMIGTFLVILISSISLLYLYIASIV